MGSHEKASILIVDDNPYNLEVLSRRLVRRDFETACVDNGQEALDALNKQSFDLVLLDIMMPMMSGIEVLTEIRKSYSKTALPVIMVSSKGESEDVVGALGLGANDYIMKPIDFPVALARIQTQLSQKREVSDISSKAQQTYSFKEGEKFGQYLIMEKIGQGGMGAVYKVLDPTLDRVLALKVILPGHELTKAQVDRFNREARAIAKIRHPNIVTVYQIDASPQHYFTMDFIAGENLSYLINEQRIDPDRAAYICYRVASALAVAHDKGIIHRDLKPSNIMIGHDQEPHLMDFGLAKLDSEEEQLTRTGDILGTPEYMAPEQVDPAEGDIDSRSDIYSLGIILYEMLTGSPPYMGTPIRVLWQKLNQSPRAPKAANPDVSDALEAVCLKAMARDQVDRYQSASELETALAPLIGKAP